MTKKKVLVTGAAGRIGSVIRRFLGEKYELSSLDIVEVEGIESHVADLAELEVVEEVVEEEGAGGDADVGDRVAVVGECVAEEEVEGLETVSDSISPLIS